MDGTRSFDMEKDADSKELYVIYRYLLKEKSQENSPFVTNNDMKIVDFIPEAHTLYMFNSIGDANTFYSQAAQKNSRIYNIFELKEDPSKRISFTNEYKPKTPPVVVVPVKRTISVAKRWVDEDNRDNKRPESVTIQLLANGKETGKSLVLNAENGWSGYFGDLLKMENGREIQYTIREVGSMKGYEAAITGNQSQGFTVTNTYKTEKIKIEGKKTWDDGDNVDGKRPESITIRLLANGVEKESRKVTEKEGWKWTFTDLPKYEKGKEITYTIAEDPVENYTSEV
ncbi:Cna B-type domain-containing protein, partial [Kallipyga massiliensis]|uniref:Cna B-type domain-containing protein n=1 Tax=Kallipyga massiliensis TaxID=1472764 RepID=UPI001FE19184